MIKRNNNIYGVRILLISELPSGFIHRIYVGSIFIPSEHFIFINSTEVRLENYSDIDPLFLCKNYSNPGMETFTSDNNDLYRKIFLRMKPYLYKVGFRILG